VPAIYYGDEIGMRYIPNLPDKEGSRMTAAINRGGSRTPMQWDGSASAGFSTAPPGALYLPLDPDPGRPDVASQRADERSLLNLVRRLIQLRRSTPALGAYGGVEVVQAGYPFVYVRGRDHLVVVNPRRDPARTAVPQGRWTALEASGMTVLEDQVRADGFGYGVFRRN
jgi:maltose alpha-D-glucosyltransferase/alpha-amylase